MSAFRAERPGRILIMSEHYYHTEGRTVGPFTEAELLALARRGEITPATLVHVPGNADWIAFEQWPPSKNAVPPPPPPPPAAAMPPVPSGVQFRLNPAAQAEAIAQATAAREAAAREADERRFAGESALRLAAARAQAEETREAPARAAEPEPEPEPAAVAMHHCQICGKDWATPFVIARGTGWVCRGCAARKDSQEKEEEHFRKQKKGKDGEPVFRTKADNRLYYWTGGLLFFAFALFFFIRGGWMWFLPSRERQEAPRWSKKLPAEWPPIALSNVAKFKGDVQLPDANTFLVRSSDGTVFGVASPLILQKEISLELGPTLDGVKGGPDIPPKAIDEQLESWRAIGPGQAGELRFTKLSGPPAEQERLGVRLFQTDLAGKKPPVEALTIRVREIFRGMAVVVVWTPKPGAPQRTAKGTLEAGDRQMLIARLDVGPAETEQLLGAPLLDHSGLLIGTITALESAGRETLAAGVASLSFRRLIEPAK